MEDNRNIASDGEAAVKPNFKFWFENFWYHYKWHTIAIAFLIITLTVVGFQMCSRTSYDIHIVYAGNYEIRRTGSGSSPHSEAVISLERVSEDFDGDGEVNVNFISLFVVNEAEKEELTGGNSNLEINEALVKEDADALDNHMIVGEHYIFFLSERLFSEYSEELDGAIFTSLEPYTKEGADYEYASESKKGIYLRSLNLQKLPILRDLPEDTVVCMRSLSPVSSLFDKRDNEKNFERSEEVMKNILAFE